MYFSATEVIDVIGAQNPGELSAKVKIGSSVMITGLKKMPELEGALATVKEIRETDGKLIVKVSP